MTRISSGNQTPLLIAIGQRIRAERRAAGISQEQLAATIGISRTGLIQIERGYNTTLYRLGLIAQALDCAVGDLLPPSEWPSDERFDGRRG